MKPFLHTLLLFCGPSFLGSASAASPSGSWEGAITLPTVPLAIRVEIAENGGEWSGFIDIPAQGLRRFALADVQTSDGAVRFRMAGIPGNPSFQGQLAPDGISVTGNFTQHGQVFPFHLKRTAHLPERNLTPARGEPGQGFSGTWQGSLRAGPVELRQILTVRPTESGLSGTMISLDQGLAELAASSMKEEDQAFQFEIAGVGGRFEGHLSPDGSEIDGVWTQSGQSLPLVFKRLRGPPDLSRPQDPREPFPYRVEEVMVENPDASLTLSGTFTCPDGPGPHPAAVLLTGSGPQDRDESILGHRPFLVLADHLTRQGIAVLRCDDRGVGRSTGDFSSATNPDFVSDALAVVRHLQARPEIDPARIGLIGHSEGGITGARAAAETEVAFLVLLAGVGVPMEQLLQRQLGDILRSSGAGTEQVDRELALQRDLFRIVRDLGPGEPTFARIRDRLLETASSDAGTTVEGSARMMASPWFADLLAYDPSPVLAKVRCPVLAVNGTRDLQVAADENLPAIDQALKSGGNPDVTIVALPDLNHLFQTSQSGAVAEYGALEESFAPVALGTISAWIRSKTGLD